MMMERLKENRILGMALEWDNEFMWILLYILRKYIEVKGDLIQK